MAIQPANAVYTGLQNAFQSLIEAVQKGESESSLKAKQAGIALLTNTASDLHKLDEARALSLQKIQQLDIHNKLATLSGLIDLQKQLNEMIVEDLQKKLVGIQLGIDHADDKLKRVKENSDLAIDFLQRENRLMKERLEGYFGKGHWEKYFGEVGIEPHLPHNFQQILESDCPFWTGRKIKETHRLILIPATLDNKPFTLNLLKGVIENPKFGHKTKIDYLNFVKSNHSNDPISNSHWILMPTNYFIPDSGNSTFADQKNLIVKYQGYHLPKALEAATCILFEYAVTGRRLFEGIYTRCEETNSDTQVIVGNFHSEGINVYSCNFKGQYPGDLTAIWIHEQFGIASLRRL